MTHETLPAIPESLASLRAALDRIEHLAPTLGATKQSVLRVALAAATCITLGVEQTSTLPCE